MEADRDEGRGDGGSAAIFDALKAGQRLGGLIPGEVVELVSIARHGPDAAELIYRRENGSIDARVLGRAEQDGISLANGSSRPFDADPSEFKLAAEAQRIKLAGLFDPMLAVTTSDIQPLPHQIRAVYGDLLPRTPLRFLLADDPGAGKTIMAGLYIKELILRDDVHRCLIVAPGGLVEQWQDELYLKFGLRFEIFESASAESAFGGSAFSERPHLIARMDQLARNEDLIADLRGTEWDLVVVDEAHRMGAHFFAGKVEKTKRFLLGEELGRLTRHLLLMTATPHAGKEDDFQLFLTLLDRDRFEGRGPGPGVKTDTADVMRRMVKEDLLTFEGKPLFPERIAETVPYELSSAERDLYEQVTAYVREGMNRAAKLDDKRRNTVGFALTILQRRLASSPEAIYRSLVRRSERLELWKQRLLNGEGVADPADDLPLGIDEFEEEELSATESESLEEELVDAATAARTVEELDIELADLERLIAQAREVRAAETDRKWSELRTIIEDETLIADGGAPRKLIIFTEHRDTLDYLERRITALLGRTDAVVTIHGGVRRNERRRITAEFTHNRDCHILLATDAAGEGLNLQAAHLMVNYDLPWNPNRIEQRFGRIHRIGQQEICRLWNLVASDTREGDVFELLLRKVEEQRQAYGGKVFDVLGAAFEGQPLRGLLLEAIQYGEQPEVRARMEQVIDESVSAGIPELIAENALDTGTLAEAEIADLRAQMDEARARRLQPHYIERAFREAFARLGGRMPNREKGRFEITNVPAALRARRRDPIATRYDRVTFASDGNGDAERLAPGHPLHDAVIEETIGRIGDRLGRGAVLVSAELDAPRLLVGIMEEVGDATEATVARRFGYAYVDEDGNVTSAGPAPYLDCVGAPEPVAAEWTAKLGRLVGAEQAAMSWLIANQLPVYLDEVRSRRAVELERARAQVESRLRGEAERLVKEAMVAGEREQRGERVRETQASLMAKSEEIEVRLRRRLESIERQAQMAPRAPRIVTAALVLPAAAIEAGAEEPDADVAPLHAVATKEVERRGVDLVMATEERLGRAPREQEFNNPGFDVLAHEAGGETIRIEVKARLAGAEDFFITHNEVMTAMNASPAYRLALVRVDPRGPEHDEVRYLANPFRDYDLGGFQATGIRGDWDATWAQGEEPF
ncbi:MAG TPA: helicase-related protein [Solirubrobacterales bacterium]|nr:helicase-related protein [Solirubrobacterales bacterium]